MMLHRLGLSRLLPALAAALLAAAPTAARAQDAAVLFILDVSGSMAQKLGQTTKMAAAKETFGELLEGLPKDMKVGLEVYGHHGDKDCSAIEVLVPPRPLEPQTLRQRVAPLAPSKGATPIAAALEKGAEVLRAEPGARTLVLISDGEETCGGDPVAVARTLRGQGYDVRIHVVGLAVDDKGRRQLAQIAEAGGGRYFDARDVEGLKRSFRQIREQLTSRVIFSDDFDGESLSDAWEVQNPNPDTMLVEDGLLLIVTEPWDGDFGDVVKNLVVLKKDLPKEFEVELKLRHSHDGTGGYSKWTTSPVAGLMLRRDKDSFVLLAISGAQPSRIRAVTFAKEQGGEWKTILRKRLGDDRDEREFTLRLRRAGRKLAAWYLDDKGKWQRLGDIPLLRVKGYRLALFATRDPDVQEVLVKFDRIVIRELSRGR